MDWLSILIVLQLWKLDEIVLISFAALSTMYVVRDKAYCGGKHQDLSGDRISMGRCNFDKNNDPEIGTWPAPQT